MNEQINNIPASSDFWDILTNGVDFVSGTLDKYLNFKQKEATTKLLTTQGQGLSFLTTGYGMVALMIFIAVIVFLYNK